MVDRKLSAYAIEKRANLKPSAVQNIIYGRSKNPSISLIKSIAEILDCSIGDLIDEEGSNSESVRSSHKPRTNRETSDDISEGWDQELYFACTKCVHNILDQQKITLSKERILKIIDEVYRYSSGHKQRKPDEYFAEWLIHKI